MSKGKDDGSSTVQYGGNIWENIERISQNLLEEQTRILVEAITKYDFIVGSPECKHKLMEILPEGANVACVPYIEEIGVVYMVKKFDVTDLIAKSVKGDEESEI